ncbi:MAG: hypothetical protein IT384_17595 [Deltaproteobacteria bacterium]|nr:hypothetical protein [Deltaproteobacteria bacterium]
MSAVAVRDVKPNFWQLGLESESAHSSATARKNDAQVAIREIEVLRADNDLIVPPEVADIAEPLVKLFQGEITSGDHLRLPQMTAHDGPAMQAAISRVLGADTRAAGASRDDVVKEEKMRRVLKALQYAASNIQQKASTTSSRY